MYEGNAEGHVRWRERKKGRGRVRGKKDVPREECLEAFKTHN